VTLPRPRLRYEPTDDSALASLALLTAVLAVLIAFEATRFAEARHRIRHRDVSHGSDTAG
jgi:hypothetical protein